MDITLAARPAGVWRNGDALVLINVVSSGMRDNFRVCKPSTLRGIKTHRNCFRNIFFKLGQLLHKNFAPVNLNKFVTS